MSSIQDCRSDFRPGACRRAGARLATAAIAIATRTLLCLLVLTTLAAAAAEVRPLKLATGELLVHAFAGGVPLPAESRWAVAQGAGPAFVPENGRHRLNWNVILKAKGSPALLRDVVRVTVQEVSGATAVNIFDGPPKPTDNGVLVLAPEHIVSRQHYPWLYDPGPTLLVFRVTLLKASEQDRLLQPVLIGADVKRQLRDGGYLP
jgi:hypothetical protein